MPLLTACVAQASAVEGVGGLSVTFDVISYASQEFSIGFFSDDWSSGQRYELNFMAQMEQTALPAPMRGSVLASAYTFDD